MNESEFFFMEIYNDKIQLLVTKRQVLEFNLF